MAITSGITLYKGNKSSALSKPTQRLTSGETVTEKSVDAGRSMRRSALLLMRKRIQRDKLESKYFRLLDRQKSKQKARNEEEKQEQTSFLGSVGSGIKQSASKLGGNLFGALGDLLGFLALNWVADPSNQKLLTGIVTGLKSVLKFIDWFVTGSVDNFFTGFNKLIAGDSILERFVGFFQMVTGAVGLFYALNPLKAFKHAYKLIKGGPRNFRILKVFFKKWQKQGLGKGLKFLFPKTSKVLENISKKFSKTFKIPQVKQLVSKILKKISISGTKFLKGNSIIQAISKKLLLFAKSGGGKGVKTALKTITKPFKKFVNKVPLIGPFLSVVINRAFGDPWDEAIIKAMGAGLGQWMGAGLGTLLFPGVGTLLGGFLGGLIGDWLGGRIYQFIKHGKDGKLDPVTAQERSKQRALEKALKEAEKKGLTGDEQDAFVDRALESWELSNLKSEQMMLRQFGGGILADETEFKVVGLNSKDLKSGHYIKIGDEVMKVLTTNFRTIKHTSNTHKNKIKDQFNTITVQRGFGGTKASSHNNASIIESLGFKDPIIKNGKYISRTDSMENGSKNKLLDGKINNGNTQIAIASVGGSTHVNSTTVNSTFTGDGNNIKENSSL